MQLKFRAAIFAKLSDEVDRNLENKIGPQLTLSQNEIPSETKEPEDEHSKSRDFIYKKYEWFKD